MGKMAERNKAIWEKTIGELWQMLESGEVTSEELVWAYGERIASLDQAGPKLNAMQEINPDAMALARLRDAQRKAGICLGPLHGIPLVLKDCIDTADRMHTTCGAVMMKNHYATEDAFLVERLRKAGAILLGKAHLSEWYGFCSSKAPSGYSGMAGGTMKNPYGVDRLKPGGSSGGCAVAVSAGYVPAAIGTETSGSIIEPAYFCSVVGWKPTVGLISRRGILPVVNCQDTPGTLTRSVADAARLANVLVEKDEQDEGHWVAEAAEGTDFLAGLETASLNGKRLAVARRGYWDTLTDGEKEKMEQALCLLRQGGAEVLDDIPDFLPGLILAGESQEAPVTGTVMEQGFLVRLNDYLGHLGDDVPAHSLEALLKWNAAHPETIPYGQDYLEKIASCKHPLLEKTFWEARKRDLDVCDRRGIGAAFQKYHLDAIVFPGVAGQGIAPRAGNPILTLPAGLDDTGKPVGLNLVGQKGQDHALFLLGAACERVLPRRVEPRLLSE